MVKQKALFNKLKPYLLTSIIVLGILSIVFLIKGIYPFGKNSLIWGDMHDQITAFYYHFYDSIKGNCSLLIDFNTSSGINFLGIMAYYILSPFTLLVLFVQRSDIYLVVSVIIAFKILLCSLTCLYFIKTYYKKLPNLLSVLLAITYAFSGYGLIMYQITSWIDAMYMFPLIMIGLKKVLDLEKPTLYIITLTLSLIFSFYVSIMVIIFIFLISLLYLFVYKDEQKLRKKGILALGITTVISLLLSSFIIIPSYMQIADSYRIGFPLNTLLNSKLGPITDKMSMFLFGGIMYLGIFLLLKNLKKQKTFLTFYIPTILIVLIPVLIEPIHKVWHFGSYAFFPYRFGFITMFLLILGACQGFKSYEPNKDNSLKKNKVTSIVLTILVSVSIFIITYVNYNDFQLAIYTLTISANHILLLILVLSTLVAFIGCLIILLLNRKLTNFSLILISIITLTHIIVNSCLYLGIDYEQKKLMSQYQELASISETYQNDNYYRVKNEASNMIMNSGMVMKYHTLDHFTSLTNSNNLMSLKKMGYSSMWVKTFSKGGNLFLDSILANKYIITRKEIDNDYYELVSKHSNLNFYSLKETPSYGYLLTNNDKVLDKENSFIISNSFYQNITNSNELIFDIINDFTLINIKTYKYKENTYYEIIDQDAYNYLEKEINIKGKKTIYLEVLKSLVNNDNYQMYEKFNIYINNKLYQQKAFTENDNGVLNLGTYENETVNIKIELRDSIDLNNITLGIMDNNKYEEFVRNEKINTNIKYNRNQVKVGLEVEEEKILFLPINYNEGYNATNNGKKVEVIKLYDNYIGIKLDKGENNITLTYIPQGFIPCLIISIITLVISIILIKTNLYQKLLNINLLNKLAYYIYLFSYLGIILVIYIGLIIVFIISYFSPIYL